LLGAQALPPVVFEGAGASAHGTQRGTAARGQADEPGAGVARVGDAREVAEADSGHFVVAYPDGLDRAWNTGGGCCGTPGRTNVDDIGFITAMVSAIEHQIPVNPNRVYATGISNGGIMAYTLACHTTIFAAIGPDSATELGSCPAPAPLSVIHIHGTADKNIPYQGGEGDGVAHIDGPAIPALNARWGGSPVARRHSQPAGPDPPAHRPAVHGPERHAGHLAVLRRPHSLKTRPIRR